MHEGKCALELLASGTVRLYRCPNLGWDAYALDLVPLLLGLIPLLWLHGRRRSTAAGALTAAAIASLPIAILLVWLLPYVNVGPVDFRWSLMKGSVEWAGGTASIPFDPGLITLARLAAQALVWFAFLFLSVVGGARPRSGSG